MLTAKDACKRTSLTLPRPRMAILVLVSRCMRCCVLPRGPMIRPMKLVVGYWCTGRKILRSFLRGLHARGQQHIYFERPPRKFASPLGLHPTYKNNAVLHHPMPPVSSSA